MRTTVKGWLFDLYPSPKGITLWLIDEQGCKGAGERGAGVQGSRGAGEQGCRGAGVQRCGEARERG
ncbi:MAG: hypothetical protein ACE5H0_04165, partial [Bacteroidota bacterium]